MNQDSGFLTKDRKPSVFHFLDHHTTDAKYNKLYNLKKGMSILLLMSLFLRSFSVFAMLLECIAVHVLSRHCICFRTRSSTNISKLTN